MAAARGVGIDDARSAKIAVEREVREERLELLVDLALEDAAVPPAADQPEVVARKDRPEHRAVARELAAELGAEIARLARLGEADLERRVAAELGHVVVGPGDGIDADPDAHAGLPPGTSASPTRNASPATRQPRPSALPLPSRYG